MSLDTTEEISRRIFECGLAEARELDAVITELGARSSSSEAFRQELLRREILTNWQLKRLDEGSKTGFFFGDWKVLYLVGAGTFARVYRSQNRKTGEVRAVKVLRQRYVADKGTTENFVREGKTVMRLQHENIIRIHEVQSDKDRTFMVMDLIEGQNLRDYVKAHGRLDLVRALTILRDLSSGLAFAFKRGITHRDLKLSNVLLSSNGKAFLVDFGLAGGDKDVTGESEDMVNPRSIDYAGLERVTKVRRNDKRSDIFFLGCMLYHMLAGKPAMTETRDRMRRLSAQRFKEIPPITSLVPDLPGRVQVLLNKMLELDANKRMQTPSEVHDAVEFILKAIEAGEQDESGPGMAEAAAQRIMDTKAKEEEGNGRTLMLIESKQKIQDLFREKLKEVGYKLLIFSDPRRALARFEYMDPTAPPPAEVVMFSCADMGADALSAFNFFATNDDTKKFPAILLVTEDQQSLAKQAKLANHRRVMSLPVKMKELRQSLLELMELSSPSVS
ncbi:MAG: serine/threonine protein kinase [Planctomycetaceae bacterium]|nr:serine/threonine protein kinase [Planctomycetaceae bacterium]